MTQKFPTNEAYILQLANRYPRLIVFKDCNEMQYLRTDEPGLPSLKSDDVGRLLIMAVG